MILLIPVAVFSLLLFLYLKRNRRRSGPIVLLIGLYLVMSCASVAAALFSIAQNSLEPELIPVVYLCLLLTAPILALSLFKDPLFNGVYIENIVVFKFVANGLVIVSLVAIIFFLPFAYQALSGHTGDNRDNMVLRLVTLGLEDFRLLNSFASVFANLFFINIILAHVSLSKELAVDPEYRRTAYMLLATSASYIVYIFAYVGRDGFVYWALTFLAIHLMLRGLLEERHARLVKWLFLLVVIIGIVPFWIITRDRFIDSEFGVYGSIVNYLGGQVQMFSDFFLTNGDLQWGRMNFPIVCDAIKLLYPSTDCTYDRSELIRYYVDSGVVPWVFATFVGSWIMDFGIYFTPIVVLIYVIAIRVTLLSYSESRRMSLSALIVFFLLYNVAMWGVFYFRHYSLNYSMVGILLVALLLRISAMSGELVFVRTGVT